MKAPIWHFGNRRFAARVHTNCVDAAFVVGELPIKPQTMHKTQAPACLLLECNGDAGTVRAACLSIQNTTKHVRAERLEY